MRGGTSETPFSFHCMICFEEFHPEDRYPVVLPCGHTYVCNLCANRLDKCMECRTPLYELVPHPKPSTNPRISTLSGGASRATSSWSSARSGGGHHYHHHNGVRSPGNNANLPAQPPMKRRLALPKNVVLLSLIEATELASADARGTATESPRSEELRMLDEEFDHYHHLPGSTTTSPGAATTPQPSNHQNRALDSSIPALHSMGSMLDQDDEEEERIKMSTSLAVGVAGTYAVAARDGLQIYPNRPNTGGGGTDHTGPAAAAAVPEEDVETLVRVYHLDRASSYSRDEHEVDCVEVQEQDTKPSPGGPKNAFKKDPLQLKYGDRVQVVAVNGGWAKLARGYGFVQAERYKLVKVGGSVDRACKLEAMLCTLSNRRKALRIEQSKIDNQFIRFMNELQHSLKNDEDLTVIPADTFSVPVEASAGAGAAHEVTIEKEEKTTAPTEDDNSGHPVKPPSTTSPPAVSPSRAHPFACFSGGVFGDDSGGTPERAADYLRSALTHSELVPFGGSQDADSEASRLFPGSAQPSPSAMRAGAQAWRERHGREPATDSGSINFRTGMSGHMALLSTHAHSHEYLEPSWSRPSSSFGSINRMSSHTGLTMFKPPTLQGIFNSLTLPVIGTPPRRENGQSQIHHTGSM